MQLNGCVLLFKKNTVDHRGRIISGGDFSVTY